MITYLNARFLTQPVSGVQRYAIELVRALDGLWDPTRDGRLVAYYPQDTPLVTAPDWQTAEPVSLPGGSGHLWEQRSLWRATRDAPLVSLCNAGPLRHAAHILAVHDAHVFDYPQAFSAPYRLLHTALRPKLARRAVRRVTVSPYSAARLTHHTDVAGWAVIANAADHVERIAPDTRQLRQLGLTERGYFLCTANRGPIKNVGRLIAAHAALGNTAPALVLVGGKLDILGAHNVAVGPNVVQAGRVSDAGLRALYEGAMGVIAPALSEGFGIPALEAATLGAPVLASRVGAQPWVLGDAADWFDPLDVASIARCLRDFLEKSHDDRAAMIDRGHERARAFRWERSAERLRDLIVAVHAQTVLAA